MMRSRVVIRHKIGSITPERLTESSAGPLDGRGSKHLRLACQTSNKGADRVEREQKAMNRTRQNEALALLQQSEPAPPVLIRDAHLTGLPEVLQRYLRYAGVVEKAPIRTVRLKQHGFMRTQPGQKWLPLVAEQYFTTTPPAFLWSCTMRPFPLAWISATDRFTGGHGRMVIKLLSFITVGKAHGPEMDQGELQRYLAEMIWFPTAWLSAAIEWQAIDASSVQAMFRAPGVTGSVVLHVNEHGQLTHVTADRYKEAQGRYLLAPWSGQCTEYQDVEGMRIPTRIAITWQLASGEFTWFRVKLTEIEYNQSGRVTRFIGSA
jgi:hypothetical protein